MMQHYKAYVIQKLTVIGSWEIIEKNNFWELKSNLIVRKYRL